MKMNFKKLLGLVAIPFMFIASSCKAQEVIEKVYDRSCTHNYEYVAFNDATCTHEGNYAYYHCTLCDYYFNENLVQVPYKSLIISQKEHNYETISKKDSTCLDKGYESYLKCVDCGHIEGYKVIDPVGHDFNEPTYTWSEDYLQVTATRVCKNDASHVESETVDTTSVVTQQQSCVNSELSTFTATFENEAFSVQTKENIKTKDAAGHDWSETPNGHDATDHWYTCSNCDAIKGKEAHTWNEDYHCDECGANKDLTGTATVSIAEYATLNSWENASLHKEVIINENIKASSVSTGASTSTTYYTTDTSWRIYNKDTLKIESTIPYIIKNVTITLTTKSGGTITGITAGKAVTVNANSCQYVVSSNCRITSISVDYEILKNQVIADNAKANLTVASEAQANFNLPASFEGTTVTWASDNEVITIASEANEGNYLATVTQPTDADVSVKLTATLTKGTKTASKDFNVTVKKISIYSVSLPSVEHLTIAQDGSSYDLASVNSGTVIDFTTTLDAGWYIASIKNGEENITVTDNKFSVTMNANANITASVLYYGTESNPLTPDEANTLSQNTLLDGSALCYVKGEVTAYKFEYTDTSTKKDLHTFTLKTTSGTFKIYKIAFDKADASKYLVGDEILFSGSLTYYKSASTGEIVSANDIESAIISVNHPTFTISSNSGEFTTNLPANAINGSTVEFTVTPNTNYTVTSVKYNGNVLTDNEGTYSFTCSKENNILISVEEVVYYSITLPSSIENGTVISNQETPSSVLVGTSVTITCTPASGYELDYLKANGGAVTVTDGTYTFNISADVEFTAAFKEKSSQLSVTYTIKTVNTLTTTGSVVDGSNVILTTTGSLNSGTIQMTSGKTLTLTITGMTGKTIKSIIISMKSNSSKGQGSMNLTAGSTTLCSISDSKFNTTNWYGNWSTSLVSISPTMTNNSYVILGTDSVVLTISASANSLYFGSITIVYE